MGAGMTWSAPRRPWGGMPGIAESGACSLAIGRRVVANARDLGFS